MEVAERSEQIPPIPLMIRKLQNKLIGNALKVQMQAE
jgi:hypothetical protein